MAYIPQTSSSASSQSCSSLTSLEYAKAHQNQISSELISSYFPTQLQNAPIIVFTPSLIPKNIDKLIEEANASYSSEMEKELQDQIKNIASLGGLDPANPPAKINIPSARETLGKLVKISSTHYPELKKQVLLMLPQLLMRDPVTEESSHGVISLAISLMKELKRDLIQTENVQIQIAVATIYGVAVELVVRHYARRTVNAVTDDLKLELIKTDRELGKLNTQKDRHLKYAVEFAVEAIKRLTTDKSAAEEILERLANVVAGVGAAYNKDFGSFFSKMSIACKGLDEKVKKEWFKNLFAIRELGSEILSSNNFSDRDINLQKLMIIQNLMKERMTSDWKFVQGALEVLGRISIESKDPLIRHAALFGAKHPRSRDENCLPGILFFVSFHGFEATATLKFDNDKLRDEHIRFEAVKILMALASTDDSAICYPARQRLVHHLNNGEGSQIKSFIRSFIPSESSKQKDWLTPPTPQLIFQTIQTPIRSLSPTPTVRQVTQISLKTVQHSDDSHIEQRSRGVAVCGALSPQSVKGCMTQKEMAKPSAPSAIDVISMPPKKAQVLSKNVELLRDCLKGTFDINELNKVTLDGGVRVNIQGKLEILANGTKALISFLKSSDIRELNLSGCDKIEKLEDLLEALSSLGVESIKLNSKFTDKEFKSLIKAIAMSPTLSNVTLDMHLEESQISELAQAAIDADKSNKFIIINLTHDPKEMNKLGMILAKSGYRNLAMHHYRAGMDLHKGNFYSKVLIYNYGISLEIQGAIDDAILCFEEVLGIDQKSHATWRQLSNCYYEKYKAFQDEEDKSKAYKCIREAIQLASNEVSYHDTLATYLEKDWKKYKKASILHEFITEMELTFNLFKVNPESQTESPNIWEDLQDRLPAYKRLLPGLLKEAT